MKIVIILATYNEKENIEKIITILEEEVFSKIKDHDMNILVADDNSPDGTGDIVRELMKKWKNIDISSGEKKGLGAAYVRAMTYAIEKLNADIMFEMDADLQHDPHKVAEFIKKIEEGYDMVVGNRYSDGGSIPGNWPLMRKIFSVVANLFVRTVFTKFSIHDWTGGYRALKKEVFLKEKAELTNYKGYIFQISFLHRAEMDGFKIGEVPFHFSDRTLGSSKIAPLNYIMDVVKYVLFSRAKELLFGKFGKFLVVGGTGLVIQLIVYTLIINATKLPLGLSNLLSAQLAIFSNYNLNNLWTFKNEHSKGAILYIGKMIIFFATSNIGVFFIQSGLIQLGEILFGRKFPLPYVYFVLATGVLLIYNFTVYSKIIWKNKK